ncbi:unnamed protein product, partial [Polarella glacialis]
SLRQIDGEGQVLTCHCEVSPDLLSMSNGRWQSEALPSHCGSFTGKRVGSAPLVDSENLIWDNFAALVCELDKIHQRSAGLDAEALATLQTLARDMAAE